MANDWVDEDAAGPGEPTADSTDEGHKSILPFRTTDIGSGGGIEFLQHIRSQKWSNENILETHLENTIKRVDAEDMEGHIEACKD